MKYHKLVRDGIPDLILSRGETPLTHVASEMEYDKKLEEKLQEEVGEFLAAPSIHELADILEVLDAIAERKGFASDEVQRVREKKATERGRFKNRIILDEA